jgi:hypothetical protein
MKTGFLRRLFLRPFFGLLLVAALLGQAAPALAEAPGEDGKAAESRGWYLGGFGGGGVSSGGSMLQSGTAFLSSGALSVSARGNANNDSAIVGGLHLGYEWAGWRLGKEGSDWGLLPAVELEGYYLGTTKTGRLENPTPRIPGHSFDTTFPLDMGLFLSNAVFTLHTPYKIHPYVGGGIGAAYLSVSGADSMQITPAEPGINHLNSNPNAASWALAAQAKAGFRADIAPGWWLFADYRLLYLGPTNYTFGSTVYPTHSTTTAWNVTFGSMYYHLAVAGIGFSFGR